MNFKITDSQKTKSGNQVYLVDGHVQTFVQN